MEPKSFSFSKERNFACVEEQEYMNYEGTPVKAPPCPKRRMRTPLSQQSFSSSMEEGSVWSGQERTAIAKMEPYVNNSDCMKLEIDEVEDCSLGPEYSDVDVKQIFEERRQEKAEIF